MPSTGKQNLSNPATAKICAVKTSVMPEGAAAQANQPFMV